MRNHLPKSVSQSTILLVLLLWAGFWFHTTPTKTILIILKTRFCFWISDFLSRLIFSGSHFLFSTHSAFTMQRLSVLNSSLFSSVLMRWTKMRLHNITVHTHTHTVLYDCIEALNANASAYRPNSNVPEIVFDWIQADAPFRKCISAIYSLGYYCSLFNVRIVYMTKTELLFLFWACLCVDSKLLCW